MSWTNESLAWLSLVCRSLPDTATIFSSFPGPHLTWLGGAGDQLLATALLAIAVCSARGPGARHLPGVTGLAVLGLGVGLGYNCGYPLNPARDLAPRIFMCKCSLSSSLSPPHLSYLQ